MPQGGVWSLKNIHISNIRTNTRWSRATRESMTGAITLSRWKRGGGELGFHVAHVASHMILYGCHLILHGFHIILHGFDMIFCGFHMIVYGFI